MGRRTRYDIYQSILSQRRINLTRAMYLCELSHPQARGHLEFLVENGFLVEGTDKRDKRERKVYLVTQKGIELRETIEKIQKMVGFSFD